VFLLHSITSSLEQLLNQVRAIRTLALVLSCVYGGGIWTLMRGTNTSSDLLYLENARRVALAPLLLSSALNSTCPPYIERTHTNHSTQLSNEQSCQHKRSDKLHCTALHCTALHCTALHCHFSNTLPLPPLPNALHNYELTRPGRCKRIRDLRSTEVIPATENENGNTLERGREAGRRTGGSNGNSLKCTHCCCDNTHARARTAHKT
jgi:hypothetical protein